MFSLHFGVSNIEISPLLVRPWKKSVWTAPGKSFASICTTQLHHNSKIARRTCMGKAHI